MNRLRASSLQQLRHPLLDRLPDLALAEAAKKDAAKPDA
jgi:hypothetical protein